MSQFFTWTLAAIAILSAVIWNMARTAPEEAFKNWARWTNQIGLHRIANLFKFPDVKDKAVSVAYLVFLLSILMLGIKGIFWMTERSEPVTSATVRAPIDAFPSVVQAPNTAVPSTSTNSHAVETDEIPLSDVVVRGKLVPANDPTPPNSCSGMPSSVDAAILLMGDSAMGMSSTGSFIPLLIRGCPAMEMKRTADGVYFNAQLYDEDSNRVVQIVENKIEALNGETYVARQSQDRASLSIKNHNGAELFYVRFLNKNTLRARGFFGCGSNKTVRVTDNAPISGFNLHGFCGFNNHIGIDIN